MDLNKNIRTIEVSVFKTEEIKNKFVFIKLPGVDDVACVTFLRKLGVDAHLADLVRYDIKTIEWIPLDVTIFFLADDKTIASSVKQMKEDLILNKFLVVPVEDEIDDESKDIFVGYSRADSLYINVESYVFELYSIGTKPEPTVRYSNEVEVSTMFAKLQKKMLNALDEFKEEVMSRFR